MKGASDFRSQVNGLGDCSLFSLLLSYLPGPAFVPRAAKPLAVLAAALLIYGVQPAAPVAAQELENVTVKGRPKPDYDALGIRLRSFQFFPKIELDETYDTNVFAKATDPKDDFITLITPSLAVKSDFSPHALNFGADAKIGRYATNSTEDYEDLSAYIDGRLDVRHALKLTAGMTVDAGHEMRGEESEAGGKEPGHSLKYSAKGGLSYKLSKFGLDLDSTLTDTNYDDVTANNGTIINNDDRDIVDYLTTLRASVDINPEYSAFTEFEYKVVDYWDSIDDGGANRDSTGTRVSLGAEFDITEIIDGEASAGYFWQKYDDPQFKDVSGYALGFDLTWNVTPLTTITGGVVREIKETTSSDVSGITSSKLEFGVDHELMRNIILSVNGSYTYDTYNGSSEVNTTISAGAAVRYLFSERYYAELNVNKTHKDNNIGTGDYGVLKTILKLGVQF
tara:strand:+ start:461 stop:1813 length:1353 start_codon:yes stop_codon:yes gene_type:complete